MCVCVCVYLGNQLISMLKKLLIFVQKFARED